MANMDVQDKVFQLPINVTADGIITKTLATADTYIDKNIKVTVTTPDAAFEVKTAGSVTATAGTTDTIYTSDTVTDYPIEITAAATAGAVTVGTKTAGFTAASDTVTVDGVTDDDAKTIYIKAGTLEGTGEASATSTTVELTKGSEASTGFVIKASAAGSATVTTAGWLPKDATAEASGDAYYTVKASQLNNIPTAGETYTEKKGPVLVSGSYLYIDEGYTEATKISLKDLVPDESTLGTVTEASKYMYHTIKAYDNDGTLVEGTMGDATLSAITADNATASISTVSVAANEGSTAFNVTGNGTISGDTSVAIATRGLAETTLSQTGAISGTANVSATVAKIGLGVTADSKNVEVTPVISKEDSTTAKSGTITTTQPATGKYVAVSTAQIQASATVTPNVATEGYGTTDLYSATGDTITAGAAGSGTYYIPLTAGTHTAEAGDPTIVNAAATVSTSTTASEGFDGDLTAGIKSTAPTGTYITISGTATGTKGSVAGTVQCTSTEGYIDSSQQTASISGDVDVTVTDAANKYIKVYDGTILD